MIYGVGVDIVKISRFEKIAASHQVAYGEPLQKNRFMTRVYTPGEQEYLQNKKAQSYAGLFAAKEAVSKALGLGFSGISPNEIEIKHDKNGKPLASINCSSFSNLDINLSISHSETDAVAFVVLTDGTLEHLAFLQ